MARSAKGSDAPNKAPKATKPKKQRFARMRQVYALARRNDPHIGWWLALAVVAVTVLGLLIGAAFGHPIYGAFVALPLGVLAAVILLSRRAEKAAYGALEGQPGAGGAALQGLRRGWNYDQEPVAVEGGRSMNFQDAAMVYRAVGRPGVVLIAEGPTGRAVKLLAAERKKVNRLVPNVPITAYRLGSGNSGGGEEVVTTRELVKRMGKLKKTLTKQEVTAVSKRLRALARVKPPVPAGMDPQRMRSMGRGQRR